MADSFPIMQWGPLPENAAAMLRSRFDVLAIADFCLPRDTMSEIRGVATSGKFEISAALMEKMPSLEIISCLGAGTEGIDTEAAARRDIVIANTSSVLSGDVADIAMGLIIAASRDLMGAERFVRSGEWPSGRYPLGTSLQNAWLGIVGLGNIGAALARRAAAFDMRIAYHGRSHRPDMPWRYVADLNELARECRFLALCCPGGPATYHLVSADVLRSLGSDGYLINVARGSVVDETALAAAVTAGTIAGAGLDVFEDEPNPHPALFKSQRVTLLPHIGSATHETRQKMAAAMLEALRRHTYK